ncbi:MAG: addiction module protein [Planctomycetaceae bacterium]|nr:addiction module protein [Planctomycetaceae bacterium]
MPTRDEIAQQALALPVDDRAFLADMLEQSLCEQGCSREEFAAYWTGELDRRMAEFERDPSQGVDAATALAEMRRHQQSRFLRNSE